MGDEWLIGRNKSTEVNIGTNCIHTKTDHIIPI